MRTDAQPDTPFGSILERVGTTAEHRHPQPPLRSTYARCIGPGNTHLRGGGALRARNRDSSRAHNPDLDSRDGRHEPRARLDVARRHSRGAALAESTRRVRADDRDRGRGVATADHRLGEVQCGGGRGDAELLGGVTVHRVNLFATLIAASNPRFSFLALIRAFCLDPNRRMNAARNRNLTR